MGLAEKLSEVDNALSSLGSAPSDLSQRLRAQWATLSLEAIDQELQALSVGVTLVDKPSPELLRASAHGQSQQPVTPAAVVAATSVVHEALERESEYPAVESRSATASFATNSEPTPSFATNSEPTPSFATNSEPTPSFATIAAEAVSDVPFVPTLPSQPPPAMETEVGRREGRRSLTMSEPPLSEPPLAAAALPSDLDPFEGKPAPIPVPQRASAWPMAPAPKRTPSRTIRTSAAPPPPLPPTSMRPRSIHPFDAPVRRPSDTPDPFAPLQRASSRPPAKLDNDPLFGGISSSPPTSGDVPIKLSSPLPPKLPSRAPQASSATVPAAASADDDFELLVDDEVMEIDVEETE